ncbi:potassium-transporting ATPase subunit KdpA [Rhodobacter sphaeroides]|uniref:Potassium-transporting ATPase potassium-binding subunit n=2 Tax=Cereibacter sphaeroides TaxID=1063 RepID=Q3IYE0_CERS4|nr:potassium-transporting ATPase subunit KdpA [Cereibacter sphaeroides]ABA80444.1 Potassium-transporting P-type ATPase, A chain, KdpA [Cereibacter sphaeroides 2.4.1]AMJ48675.1 ATPase [Cereibacter sphaeroides]ANS35390.1 potassium-transporting ATPase subunit KdpA [Cereibacter sphaeroides]ATN64443.1 potassium-transporting ATPase subunit KdpA [Cereibacter sphaeroides]AXC62631.1 potassium-transporting ATPase subunit KdpA [Cereibacter sphaeroides 2.4.1]
MSEIWGLLLFLAALAGGGWLLGAGMARLYAGDGLPAGRRLLGRSARPQGWTDYAMAVLAFNAAGFLALYALLRLQGLLPLNPDGVAGMAPDLAFNTALSFVTNTNWQAYSGEAQLSYLAQMLGLTVQNFVSAGTGMAVGVAVIRGFTAPKGESLGNFWTDLSRSVLWVLLPLSAGLALILILQGVPQTLLGAVRATTLEGAEQIIARGPAASQIAIKQLGTNGGGFFGVNSAHPFENPTILSDLVQCYAILVIPVAFCFLFGRMAGDGRQGRAIFAAMSVLFLAGLAVILWQESAGNPLMALSGGNMEGKEVRFGPILSGLWAAATTAASNGSVNAMHDSFLPLSGLVMLVNMQVGEVIFGGVGSGLYGMLLYVVLAVFLAGLMVGRTPEYLGRRVEAREVVLAVLAFLSMPVGILAGGALSASIPAMAASVQEAGPHGLSEILYAYSSATGNNGSAFAGWNAATPWQTTALGLLMLFGRFAMIVPMLAIAGSLVRKTPAPATAGTFPTHGPLFVTLLVLTVAVFGALTFFPVLALGPLAEQAALAAGQSF